MQKFLQTTFVIVGTLVSLFATSCTLELIQNTHPSSSSIKVTLKDPNDQVVVQTKEDTIVIEIESASGIGQADIELSRDRSPKAVSVQLRVSGLEMLRLSYESTDIVASVFSTIASNTSDIPSTLGLEQVSQRVLIQQNESTEEQQLSPESAYWISIVPMLGKNDSASDSSNLFELFMIEVPQDFIDHQHRALTVEWIDFYR